MDSSRQLLLGTGVFLGGGLLLFAMVKQLDSPQDNIENGEPKVEAVSSADNKSSSPLTADVDTEERILEQKRIEREKKEAELDRRTREFLSEQEKAEKLAMQKAREENELYRTNAAEPIIEESLDQNETSIAKPVVTPRTIERPQQTTQSVEAQPNAENITTQNKPNQSNQTTVDTQQQSRLSNNSQTYTVQRGEGLIKLARYYGLPVEALAEANNLTPNSTLRLGQEITIPSQSQVNRLLRDYNAKNPNAQKAQSTSAATSTQSVNKPNPAPTSSAPTRSVDYKVERGDGLIKLAREYNVPVEALAAANNLSANATLRLGQEIKIPSRKQVARLEREAQKREASVAEKREAQKRLQEARREAAKGEVKGTFGVQVALADNQKKADEIVQKLRRAGYSASTSSTTRGVRVIVGPEKGKQAALALKDKINADPRTGVNNAWVLYWR